MVYPYKINSKEDLVKLCELATKEDFPIYISTPYGQIDARSLLGLFTVVGQDINNSHITNRIFASQLTNSILCQHDLHCIHSQSPRLILKIYDVRHLWLSNL